MVVKVLDNMMERRPRPEIWDFEPMDLSKKKVVELQQWKLEKQRMECENYEPIDLTDRNKKPVEPSVDFHATNISLTEEEMSSIDTEFGLHLSSIFDRSALEMMDQRDPSAPGTTLQSDQVRQNPSVPDEVEPNLSSLDDTVELVEGTRNAARLIFLKAERDFHHLIYCTLSQEIEAQSKNSSCWPISGSKIIALQNKVNVYINDLKALVDSTMFDHDIPATIPPNEESRVKNVSVDTFGYRIPSIDEVDVHKAASDNTTFDHNIPATIPPNEESRVENVSVDTFGYRIPSIDEVDVHKDASDNTTLGSNVPNEESKVKNISFDSFGNQTASADEHKRKAAADNTTYNHNTPDELQLDEEFRVKNFSYDTSCYPIVPADENGRYRLPLVIPCKGRVDPSKMRAIMKNWSEGTLFKKIGDREIYYSDKIPLWDATNQQETKPELLKDYKLHKNDTFNNGFALPLDRICLFVYVCRKNSCPYFRFNRTSIYEHEKFTKHGIFNAKRKRQHDQMNEKYHYGETVEKNQSQHEEDGSNPRKLRAKRRCYERTWSKFQSYELGRTKSEPQQEERRILTVKLERCQ